MEANKSKIGALMGIKMITIGFVFFFCFDNYAQDGPERMNLRQGFIDSMHVQTREHIIIDTLSDYYNQFEYSQLNEQQKSLVFIRNFQDTLYNYDFVDLLVNHSEFILVRAYDVFKRINCQSTLDQIEDFRKLCDYFAPFIIDGKIPAILDEDSHEYDDSEVTKIYAALLAVEAWITFLPREKVLKMYEYIVDNQLYLYK